MNQKVFSLPDYRPRLGELGRAATFQHQLSRQEKCERVMMYIGEEREDEEGEEGERAEPYSVSDASVLRNHRAAPPGYHSPQFSRHQAQQQLVPHSQPHQGQGHPFTHARASRSSDNLLDVAHGTGEWSSSDEGDLLIECSVCYQRFEEECSKTPRNLQCGHAFCTGELLSRPICGWWVMLPCVVAWELFIFSLAGQRLVDI